MIIKPVSQTERGDNQTRNIFSFYSPKTVKQFPAINASNKAKDPRMDKKQRTQNQEQEEAVSTMNLSTQEALQKRPGVIIVGPPNVGKRTLLSRLLHSCDLEDFPDPLSDIRAYGWTIKTKYYTADVSILLAHLQDELSIARLPTYDNLQALVMVFDMNDLSSFTALKEWVSRIDLQKFDILLCIGNKVDLLPGHPAHVEYRRRLLKKNEPAGSNLELSQYGISENEGRSLLGDEESSFEFRKSCFDWCIDQNIEFVEGCASNFDFDKCLSIDGDSQGVERLHGALAAHMWPGMVLNSGDKINEPSLVEQEDLSEEESDYELEYERLSNGSEEPVDDTFGGWVSFNEATASGSGESNRQKLEIKDSDGNSQTRSVEGELQPSTSASQLLDEIHKDAIPKGLEIDRMSAPDEAKAFDFEDLEQLMSEIGNMRNNLRLMPDFQRRDMAANLAMKMAEMFFDDSENEGGFD